MQSRSIIPDISSAEMTLIYITKEMVHPKRWEFPKSLITGGDGTIRQ